MKRFSAYLFQEILPLYFAGLITLLLLLLGTYLLDVLADVIARGTSPRLVASFLLYSLPSAAGPGIPLALLFAALLGITRLGQDSEIKAALLLGLSPGNFARPILLLGLVVSLFSFFNNEIVIPWSSQKALEVQKDILIQSPETLLEEGSFFTDALGRSVYIGKLEPNGIVEDVVVIQAGSVQGPREVISAQSGVLDEAAGVWKLEQVRFTSYKNSRVSIDSIAETAELPVRKLAVGGVNTTPLSTMPIRKIAERIRESSRKRPAEWTALHRKFAEPLAASAFALFALAVGLYSFRSGFGLGLVSVLFLTFVYYATSSVSTLLGAQGTIPAWLAGWIPFALYAFSGTVILLFSWRR